MNARTNESNTHGHRCMSERRLSLDEQIAFYALQAKLARAGLVTRRTPEYFERQVQYFQLEKDGYV